MSRSGIYWRLRDADTPWSDKLKLLRYAWTQDTVHVPNKHQVLLDWFVLELTGKKRVSAEEGGPLWRCFNDMLHSNHCQHGSPLLMRNIVAQVLIKELGAHVSGGLRHCSDTPLLTSCIHGLMTSHSLKTIFTNKLETLIQLTGVLLELCLSRGDVEGATVLELLNMALDELEHTDWSKLNTPQVLQTFCNHLLLPICKLAQSERHSPLLHQLGHRYSLLKSVITKALFHNELFDRFQFYLTTKIQNPTAAKSTLPKEIDFLFTTLEKHLNSKEHRDLMLEFIPDFYARFLQSYKKDESSTWFDLLVLLLKMIGLDPQEHENQVKNDENQVKSCENQVKSHEVRAGSRLLEVTEREEVFSPALDNASGKNQVNYFQKLGQLLLQQHLRTAAWFSCFRHLVALDHRIVEMSLSPLLLQTWLNTKDLDYEAGRSQDELLASLVTLYGRLRRFPALIDKCQSALIEKSEATPIAFPKTFTNSLVTVISSLQPKTCVTLWQAFLTQLSTHYTLDDNMELRPGVDGVLGLLSLLLLHARLADSTTPHQVSAQVTDLMTRTQNATVSPALKLALKNPHFLPPAVRLAWCWGELHLLLSQYTHHSHEGATTSMLATPGDSIATTHHDLTILYPVLVAKQWNTVFKKAKLANDPLAMHYLNLLVVQKLRALLLSRKGAEPNLTSINNIVTYIIDLLPPPADLHFSANWDGELTSVCEGNHQVALVDLVLEQLPLILPFTAREQLLSLTELLVSVSIHSHQLLSEQDGRTLPSVVGRFLRSTTFQELPELHLALITVAAKHLLKITTTKTGKSPKKQKSCGPSPAEMLNQLASTDIDWHSTLNNNEELNSVLEAAGKDVMKLFEDPEEKWQTKEKKVIEVINIVKIFDHLPLEFLKTPNRMRCLLIFLAATGSNQLELVRTGMDRLILVLDSPDTSLILPKLNACHLLLWLLQDNEENTVELRTTLMQIVLKYATKNLSIMQSIGPYFKMVRSMLRTSGVPSSNQHMVLLAGAMGTMKAVAKQQRSSQLEHLCSQYFQELCDDMLKLLDRLREKSSTHGIEGPVWECALTSYRHMVNQACYLTRQVHLEKEKAKKEKEKAKKEAGEKAEKDPTKKTETKEEEKMVVSDSSDSDESESESESGVSNTSTSETESEGKRSKKGEEEKEEEVPLLTEVKSRLPSVCDLIFTTLQQNQRVSSAIKCCLPLILATSANYTTLQSHLPSEFFEKVLAHLLTYLYSLKPRPSQDPNQSQPSIQSHALLTDVRDVLIGGELGQRRIKVEGGESREGKEGLTREEEEMLYQVQTTVAAIISVLDEDNFTDQVYSLLQNLNTPCLQYQPMKVLATMGTMQALLDSALSQENYRIMGYASQSMLLPLQELVQHFSRREPVASERQIVTRALATQAKMLTHGETLISARAVTVCLHSCQYVPLECLECLTSYSACHQAAYDVLNEMLVHQERHVFRFIPTFIGAAKRLMTSVILQGDQGRRPQLSDCDSVILVTAALRVHRLFSLIATHKVDFAKVAPFIVADYIEHLQKVTLLPKVKKSLVVGVHKILDLCDPHAIALLRTALPSGGKEIFRSLHVEHNKYYKYSGRV